MGHLMYKDTDNMLATQSVSPQKRHAVKCAFLFGIDADIQAFCTMIVVINRSEQESDQMMKCRVCKINQNVH